MHAVCCLAVIALALIAIFYLIKTIQLKTKFEETSSDLREAKIKIDHLKNVHSTDDNIISDLVVMLGASLHEEAQRWRRQQISVCGGSTNKDGGVWTLFLRLETDCTVKLVIVSTNSYGTRQPDREHNVWPNTGSVKVGIFNQIDGYSIDWVQMYASVFRQLRGFDVNEEPIVVTRVATQSSSTNERNEDGRFSSIAQTIETSVSEADKSN